MSPIQRAKEADSGDGPRPAPPNIATIVTKWLRAHGYDGLCIPGECGCCVDDLMPCGCCCEGECRAGYKGPPTPEGGDWAIYLSREAAAEAESVPDREPNDRTPQNHANDSRSGTQGELCPGCGLYPSDDGGLCPGCEAYRDHTDIY